MRVSSVRICMMLAVGGGACSADHVAPERAAQPSSALAAGCTSSRPPWFQVCWTNGYQISVKVGASATGDDAALQQAIGVWNSALADPRTPNVPRFLYIPPSSPVPPDFIVERAGNSATPCGDEVGGVITLRDACGPGAHRDVPWRLLAHELTAPLGFQESMENKGIADVSDHCINTLPTPADIHRRSNLRFSCIQYLERPSRWHGGRAAHHRLRQQRLGGVVPRREYDRLHVAA